MKPWVELSVSCENLRAEGRPRKTLNPQCVLFVQNYSRSTGPTPFVCVGNTEIKENDCNPVFTTKIKVKFFFGMVQRLEFEVHSVQGEQRNFVGRTRCTLVKILKCGRVPFRRLLLNDQNIFSGSLIVTSEESAWSKGGVTMKWAAENLSKPDAYLAFYRYDKQHQLEMVHRTEVVRNTLNPSWKSFVIGRRVISGADRSAIITIRIFSHVARKELLHEVEVTLNRLSSGRGAENTYSWEDNGTKRCLKLESYEEEHGSLVEYLQSGMQIHFSVAIDCGLSNGDPKLPSSMHYKDPNLPSQYDIAITTIGDVIIHYDSDKMFPVFGFGAKVPPSGQLSQEFFMNGDPSTPYVRGVEGILEAYHLAMSAVIPSSPVWMAPVINHITQVASNYSDGAHYFVLLIITDGEIDDLAASKKAIIEASSRPVSIIIVGVGNKSFANMSELSEDSLRVNMEDYSAERDIVQFVALKEFLGDNNVVKNPKQLAKKLLENTPEQVLEFMKARGIKPGTSASLSPGVPTILAQGPYPQLNYQFPKFKLQVNRSFTRL